MKEIWNWLIQLDDTNKIALTLGLLPIVGGIYVYFKKQDPPAPPVQSINSGISFADNTIVNAPITQTGDNSPVTIFQGVTFNLTNKEEQIKFFDAFKEFIEQNLELKKDFDKLYGKIDIISHDVKDIKDIVSQFAKLTANNATPTEIHTKLQEALQAKENAEQTLEELKTIFKDELAVKNLIIQAEDIFKTGDIDSFDSIMDEAIHLKEKLNKISTAKMYYSRAEAWTSRFNYQKSYENLSKAVKYDPDNIEYLLWLSKYELELAKYDDSILRANHVITLLKHEPDSAYLTAAYNNLGETYRAKGEYDKAIDYYNKSLDIKLGAEHPSVATSYNNLGATYHNKGEYDTAIEYYNKSLAIWLKTLGEDHLDLAPSYNNLGVEYHNQGEYDKAIEYHNKSLNIRLKTLGGNHPDVATSCNNLGGVYHAKREYNKAIEYYNKSLDIRLKTLGDDHPDIATSYNNLGGAYSTKGEVDKAIDYYNKSLVIRLKTLGAEHPDVATSYNNLGAIYYKTKDYAKAEDYFNKALDICLKTLGKNHPYTQTTKKWLLLVQKAKNGG